MSTAPDPSANGRTPAEAVEAGADAEAVPAPVAEEAERTGRPKSRRRSRSRKEPVEAASEGPALSPFGELIEPAAPTDAEADRAPEIVAVPETDAPKPKRRERVRKPAAAVLEINGGVARLTLAQTGPLTGAGLTPPSVSLFRATAPAGAGQS